MMVSFISLNLFLSKRPTVEAVSLVWISLATGKVVALLFCARQHFHVLELVWSRGAFHRGRMGSFSESEPKLRRMVGMQGWLETGTNESMTILVIISAWLLAWMCYICFSFYPLIRLRFLPPLHLEMTISCPKSHNRTGIESQVSLTSNPMFLMTMKCVSLGLMRFVPQIPKHWPPVLRSDVEERVCGTQRVLNLNIIIKVPEFLYNSFV